VRAALFLVFVCATSVALAEDKGADKRADTADAKDAKPAVVEKAPPTPVSPATQAVLDRVAKGEAAAIDELGKLAPTVIPELGTFLARAHTSPVDERRKLLLSFHAQVPDAKGRFTVPDRKTAKEEKALDDLDWLAELKKQDAATPGVGETIADIAVLRALSATKDIAAAQILFDAAFWDDTMIYRDEVGRYLRKMEPYCIPALMKESQGRNYDRKRYSNYQLERLDRQEPGKALAASAGDEELTLAILETWRETKHREAVHEVWDKVNADSPRVRAKAREAWRAYIEGPAPKPAPMKKLVLPGGKLTKKEKPLWLTYRELADNELRKHSNELLGTDYIIKDPTLDDSDAEIEHPKKVPAIDQKAVTQELFDYYDKQRAQQETTQWTEANAKAMSGDTAGAVAMLDRLLAANPDHGSRTQMAAVYFDYAKSLEKQSKWADAAAAYSKAQGLAPQGPHATDALAAHYYMEGKALESQGKDGGPWFRKAVELRPDYAPAKAAAVRASGGSKPTWMIYGAIVALIMALGLFAAAMARRGKPAA
jgi:tetratricopeptide (TPR) repeat protein